jgi:TRAP transporter 4TM/12TM fusion protein
MSSDDTKKDLATESRYRDLPGFLKVVFYVFVVLSLFVALEFFFSFGIGGIHLSNWQYYYLLMAFLFPFLFLFIPARKAASKRIGWYDYLAAALAFVIPVYFSSYVDDMQLGAWSMHPSPFNFTAAFILILLTLESSRRAGGTIFFFVCLFFGIYPLISPYMPGLLQGPEFGLSTLVGHLGFDSEGFMGIPMQVIGGILIGFLVFAGLLIRTGAGDFFLNLAMVIAGHTRGGPAKVAVIGSAFFGSLSGSIFANIVGTGSMTIPAMKKVGFPPHYAGSVEACASTGGVLMPPVMGAVAFVMSAMTNIPYVNIMIAAFVPSILYYLALVIQVDGRAARTGLKGMPKDQIPKFWPTLKDGWHFIFVLIVLVWGLVYMRWEAITPFYASALLVVLAMVRKKTRINGRKMLSLLDGVGKLLVDTLGIILPIALVVCGLVVTGVAPSFTSGIVALSGGNAFIALLFGAAACYVLGMVGMLIAAYIFLAMSLAPVLITAGFDMLATHLFILYYAMLSAITPPVAAGSFLAAGIAGAHPMKTAWTSMKMGVVIYIVPFFFIFEPSLILKGPIIYTLFHFSTAVLGVFLLASSVEGYMLWVGTLSWAIRIPIGLIGVMLAVPEWKVTLVGACLGLLFFTMLYIKRRRLEKVAAT